MFTRMGESLPPISNSALPAWMRQDNSPRLTQSIPTPDVKNVLNKEISETISGYEKSRTATEADIKAGYSLDHTAKLWPNGKWGLRPMIPMVSTPARNYITSTRFKYSHWVRIEDTRKVYSVTGVLLSEGKKYRMELTRYLSNIDDQKEAIAQLIDATVEYGFVAPEPCTERWIQSEDYKLNELQHFRVELFNFYNHCKILDYDRGKGEREEAFNFLKRFDDPRGALIELEKQYINGMFIGKREHTYLFKSINKRLKRKKK